MQQTTPFSFRRIRSFDEVFSDTFVFLRLHFRYLGKLVLFAVGPLLLLAALLGGVEAFNVSIGAASQAIRTILTLIETLPDLLTQIITYVYIVLCASLPSGTPPREEIWSGVRWAFWRVIGANIVSMIAVGIGLMLVIIPGIYVGVALATLSIVIIQEERGVFSAFDRCFVLIKERWWQTFGIILTMFVVLLVFYVASSLPSILLEVMTDAITDNSTLLSLYNTVGSIISNIASALITIVFNTAIAIQYYSLVEQKEAPGLHERVSALERPANDSAETDKTTGFQPIE